ncbi:PAS domain-containing sensor histidine kinase [Fibrella aquatilis]|uniref:histidine kinase n=1 Tax=Fibrella aquatilis TaxID=2817059 RepID=A0A939GBU2_9BACT|nr:ATP-binding protein [Fibrella aquatilis]MBO0933737.1 PAS domain-containing protein [Fibrella aquatilis]
MNLSSININGVPLQLTTLFNQAPLSIAIYEGPTHLITLANPSYCNDAGRTANELIGKPFLSAFPELASQGFGSILDGVFTTGQPYIADGRGIALNWNGRQELTFHKFTFQPIKDDLGGIIGIFSVSQEVTDQVLARQRADHDQQLLHAVFTQTPLGVGVFDGPGYIIEFANPAVCELWGRTPNQVLGQKLFEALPEVAGQGFEELLDGVRTTGVPFVGNGLPAQLDRNGQRETVYFDFVYKPMLEADGTIRRVMVVATEVTQTMQARQALEASEARYRLLAEELEQRVNVRTAELQQANKNLESSNFDLMQFASVASHDLKEPLRKIQAFGTILQSTADTKLDETERDYFQRMITATGRMQALVDDVLNLSKLSNQYTIFAETDLNAVLAQLVDDLDVTIRERGASIEVSPLPTLPANTGQLHQLFQNLISNAMKFSTDRPPVIQITQHDMNKQAALAAGLPPARYVRIDVRDNGIGFDTAYQDKIFGIFQRLHGARFGGTGIGLAICKKIVENHQGRITVDSTPGQGSTFHVWLPMKQ